MLDNYYYARTIRGIITAFSDLFDNLKVYTYNSVVSGDVSAALNIIDVDLVFGPSDKVYLDRLRNKNGGGRRKPGTLPILTIIPKSCSFDKERSRSSNEARYFGDLERNYELQNFFQDVMPVPYNYYFDVKIRCAEWDHVIQIMENVLPHFNPHLHLSVREISFLNWKRDLLVEMVGDPSFDFKEEYQEGDKREIDVDMQFVVKGVSYRPFSTAHIIRIINTNYFINEFTTSAVDNIHDFLVDSYSTSGFDIYNVSAFPNPNRYDVSGYEATSEVYWFTSASNYP